MNDALAYTIIFLVVFTVIFTNESNKQVIKEMNCNKHFRYERLNEDERKLFACDLLEQVDKEVTDENIKLVLRFFDSL